MKKIDAIKITAVDDKQSVQKAFDEYFAKPNAKTALKVVYNCARQMMVDSPVKQINLGFERVAGSACYKDGTIKISIKNLKKCKKIEQMPEMLISLFHEYSHAVTEYNNKLITEKQVNGEFLQPYFDGLFYNFFNRILYGDLELASACSMYYYFFNKNEDKARKDSSEMAQKFVDEFCKGRKLTVKTHKQLNDKLYYNLYNLHKDLRYSPKLPENIVKNYQKRFIEKLPEGVTDNELDDFLLSAELNLSPKAREALIDFAIKTKEFDCAKTILEKPQVKVTKDELEKLKQIYGNEEIDKLVFGEFKICNNDKQISK